MRRTIELFSKPKSEFYVESAEKFYHRLDNVPNTIISLQYNSKKFLTFKVNEASQGAIVHQGVQNKEVAVQCQIRGTTYILTREHLDQLSNRERGDLLNHLRLSADNFSNNN